MSSLTAQESSANQGDLPINQGTGPKNAGSGSDPSVPFQVGDRSSKGLDVATTEKVRQMNAFYLVKASDAKQKQTSYGNNASGTSETRRGEDLSFQQEGEGQGFVGKKTGSESLIDSIEGSVHERGEAGDFDPRSLFIVKEKLEIDLLFDDDVLIFSSLLFESILMKLWTTERFRPKAKVVSQYNTSLDVKALVEKRTNCPELTITSLHLL